MVQRRSNIYEAVSKSDFKHRCVFSHRCTTLLDFAHMQHDNIKCTNHHHLQKKNIIMITSKEKLWILSSPCNIKTFLITSSNWILIGLEKSLKGQNIAKGRIVNREMFINIMVRGSGNSALASLHMMILKSTKEEERLRRRSELFTLRGARQPEVHHLFLNTLHLIKHVRGLRVGFIDHLLFKYKKKRVLPSRLVKK